MANSVEQTIARVEQAIEEAKQAILEREAALKDAKQPEECHILQQQLAALQQQLAAREQRLTSLEQRLTALEQRRTAASQKELLLLQQQQQQPQQPGTGGGASAEAAAVRYEGPAYHRLCLSPSDCATPWKVRCHVPEVHSSSHRHIQPASGRWAFIAGREVEVGFDIAPPAMLLSPEFGVVHDAAYLASRWTPPSHWYQAAIKHLDCMARFHRDENSRLEAFCDWHDKWVGFRFSDARRGSISSGSADKPCLDGEFYVVGSSCNYLVVLLEVKDELGSSGDPHYQLQRYMQQCYSKRMWHEDPVICALGAPALGVDLAGPNLLIHGLYTLHSDCIVSEALTPRIPLVQQGARQPRQLHLLAATLAGYAAAAWALAERMVRAAGGVAADLPLLEQRAREVLGSLSQLGVEYEAALASASLEPAQVQAVADWRVAAAPAPTAAAPLPPYPLLHSIDAALSQLPGLDGKLLYTATEADGRAQFIKFTTLLYPKHVHDAWQEEGLVPTLHRCDALPGAYCCVATELLAATDGWKMLPELGDSSPDQQQCFGAVEQALSRAHSILVQHGGGRAPAVHGDMRGPNIMVRRARGAEAGGGAGWEVRFVDLDWAGLEGVARYPARMSAELPWHPGAKPGSVLQQAHDVHLLQRAGRKC